nr:MAG TPA: hypothetical protein [Caudoviricetes sp.]
MPRGSPITIRGDVPYRCRAGGEAPKASDKKRAARCGKRGRLQT